MFSFSLHMQRACPCVETARMTVGDPGSSGCVPVGAGQLGYYTYFF